MQGMSRGQQTEKLGDMVEGIVRNRGNLDCHPKQFEEQWSREAFPCFYFYKCQILKQNTTVSKNVHLSSHPRTQTLGNTLSLSTMDGPRDPGEKFLVSKDPAGTSFQARGLCYFLATESSKSPSFCSAVLPKHQHYP